MPCLISFIFFILWIQLAIYVQFYVQFYNNNVAIEWGLKLFYYLSVK